MHLQYGHHHQQNIGITRQRDGNSSVVIGGRCTVNDGVSAFVMGTTNTRTTAWDDELADNACIKYKERTDFLGRYFAAEDGRGGQEASVHSRVSLSPEIQLCYGPKAWVTRNQEIFTIKEASDKLSRGRFSPRRVVHVRASQIRD